MSRSRRPAKVGYSCRCFLCTGDGRVPSRDAVERARIEESAAIEDGCPYDWDLDTGDDFCPVCDRCGFGQVLPCGCDASGLWPRSAAVTTRLAEVAWSR